MNVHDWNISVSEGDLKYFSLFFKITKVNVSISNMCRTDPGSVSVVTLEISVTLSMSAASLRLWAMSSDSVSRSFSKAVLYNWPTSSLCRQSFTWFTRKCITAFGTLRRTHRNGPIIAIFQTIVKRWKIKMSKVSNMYLSWMFFRTIRKYDLMSLSMTSQSLCSRADNFLDTGTGWQWKCIESAC